MPKKSGAAVKTIQGRLEPITLQLTCESIMTAEKYAANEGISRPMAFRRIIEAGMKALQLG